MDKRTAFSFFGSLLAVGLGVVIPDAVGWVLIVGGGIGALVSLTPARDWNVLRAIGSQSRLIARPDPEAEKKQHQRTADALTEMHSDGAHVLEGCNDVDDFRGEAAIWVTGVVETMRTLGCTETEVGDIAFGSYEKMGITEDVEIERQTSIFKERLKRLKEIAWGYQSRANGITP